MNLHQLISNLGLTNKEATIYLKLLELHESLPSTIARQTGIKRPTTYLVLEKLKQKGLVSEITKNKHLHFRPISPHSLLEDQRNKYQALKTALPELLSLNQKFQSRPQMSVFEGKSGLIQIMEDTLTTKTELYCWADVDQAVKCLKDYYPTYIHKKVKNNIWLRGIICDSPLARQFQKKGQEELRELYLVPKEEYPFTNEINIYDDKVAIISPKDEVGVIIQNQNIADTQRAIFKMGFQYAKHFVNPAT